MDINTVKNVKNLNTLDKVMRTVLCENAETGYNHNHECYYPVLEVGNIVQCQFIGIGSEFNDLHFGIVWSVSKAKETFLIVPLTSKSIERTKSQFSIGKIPNFITSTTDTSVKESFVYVNKITEVSRKKVKLWFQKDSNGKTLKDSKNKHNLPVKISLSQVDRIKEGVELELLHKNNYLYEIIKCIDKDYLPTSSIDEDILKMGYRKIDYHSSIFMVSSIVIKFFIKGQEHEILFKKFEEAVFNDNNNYSNETVRYHNSMISRRNEILKALFSEDEVIVSRAKVFLPKE